MLIMIIIMKILGMPLKVFTTLYHPTTKVFRKWFETILLTSTSKVLRNCERMVLEYGKTISNYMLRTGTGTLYMLGLS